MISVNKAKFQNLDKWLVAAVCVLSIFGIICIGSALHVNLGEDPSNYYSQMVFFATGLVIMFIVAFFDIDYLSRCGLQLQQRRKMDKNRSRKTSAVRIFESYYDLLYGEFY